MMEKLSQVESASIPVDGISLEAELALPRDSQGIVLFAHGSGSSRHSARNQFVSRRLLEHGLGTLLFDLLSQEEEAQDQVTGHLRFDIGLLAKRLLGATRWVHARHPSLRLGYFGSSTGGAAALVAAAHSDTAIAGVVSRGGRPDLAAEALPLVKAPVLLLVGSRDSEVIELNRQAARRLNTRNELRLIPGAGHLFEEPGTLELVAQAAAEWFVRAFR